jgi:prephenate dehydratase
MNNKTGKIAFQGELGANSHIACSQAFPQLEPLPCRTFDAALRAIADERAEIGMIPIENSVAGRVGDIHHLLPGAGLYIQGEYFLPLHHQLLGLKGAKIEDIRSVHSHIVALSTCRKAIKKLDLEPVVSVDTAAAANMVSQANDPSKAAIASKLAAEVYGLDILAENIEDEDHNTTRFLVLSNEPNDAEPDEEHVVTSFVFKVRNVPAALYKALGGFATNGVNVTKLESYQLEGAFTATQFYADIEGHPANRSVRLALEELQFYTTELNVLGIYKAHPFRILQRD